MQVFEFFAEPVPHLVVSNFFSPSDRALLMNSIKRLEHLMTAGEMEHNQTKLRRILPKKQNLNLWVYEYPDDGDCQNIAELIEKSVWSEVMKKEYLKIRDSLFQHYEKSNYSQILLSKYTRGSMYDWHKDLLKSLTANIWISDDEVDGGDLYLKSNFEEIKKIKYQDNTCIMYPSETMHRVSEVTNDVVRYSIQYFAQTLYNQSKVVDV